MDKKEIEKELKILIEDSVELYFALAIDYDENAFENSDEITKKYSKEYAEKIQSPKLAYHIWYNKTYRLVHHLAPERLEEFKKCYTGDTTIKNSNDLGILTAGMTHYLQGFFIDKKDKKEDFFQIFLSCFEVQTFILSSIAKNFDNPLFTLENDISRRIYKSEIDIAKDIQKQGHLKIAGAVAGVIIEAHLKTLVANKNITLKSKDSLSTYNDALKKDGAYPESRWRQIQTCGDIRNNCIHSRDIDPDEIDTIIRTAEQIIADYN